MDDEFLRPLPKNAFIPSSTHVKKKRPKNREKKEKGKRDTAVDRRFGQLRFMIAAAAAEAAAASRLGSAR